MMKWIFSNHLREDQNHICKAITGQIGQIHKVTHALYLSRIYFSLKIQLSCLTVDNNFTSLPYYHFNYSKKTDDMEQTLLTIILSFHLLAL